MITETWKDSKKVYIAGAQSRAKTLKGYLNMLYPEMEISAFLVDCLEENDISINHIPVLKRGEDLIVETSCPVFIATKGIYHERITEELQKIGFQSIIAINVEVDNFFRNAYVRKYYELHNMEFVKLDELSDSNNGKNKSKDMNAVIYVAKSIYDRPLQSTYTAPDYEKCIQVGAALTEERLDNVEFIDSIGENISKKNRQYCELTALYWIWKNTCHKICGLAHYRRHFVLPKDWAEIMEENDIDVILPVPTYISPNVSDNYRERHDSSDWDYLMKYLEENYKKEFLVAQNIYSENLYSPCNMFIAKREVLEEMCTFIFPIIDAIVEHGGQKEDVYFNRYPGFISERLITLFFRMNEGRFKVVYADKTFLS